MVDVLTHSSVAMKEMTPYNGPTRSARLLAPAKINLCLHVLNRREDGYHDLAMLMQALDLCDRIELTVGPGEGVSTSCDGVTLKTGEDNLTTQAARALLERAGIEARVEITLEKWIPVAAGLGGGSSDAATVINGLNDLLEAGLTVAERQEIAAPLGADIPFFIDPVPSWATGIGEVLTPAPELPPLTYVLVNPGLPVSTPWVYRNLALTSFTDTATFPKFFRSPGDVVRLLHNTLETVTIPAHPVVGQVKEKLLQNGALGALMCGSGPTVFGLFSDRSSAQKAADAVAEETDWRVFVTEPMRESSAKV